jgi:hypothetical protein
MPAGGTVVYWSKPFLYHLYDNDTSYVIIPGEIRAMVSAGAYLFIGTDSAMYAFADGVLTPLADYGVVSGRPAVRYTDGSVWVHSKQGVCSLPEFTNHTYRKLSLPPGTNCATAYIDTNGIKQFLALTDGLGDPHNRRYGV